MINVIIIEVGGAVGMEIRLIENENRSYYINWYRVETKTLTNTNGFWIVSPTYMPEYAKSTSTKVIYQFNNF